MNKYIIQKETLTGIADAIRAKTGDTATMTPPEMPGLIENIKTGFPNGTEWTKSNLGPEAGSGYLKYADGIWVVAGTGIYYSTDGKTWTQSNVSEITFVDLAYGGGVWVAAAFNSVLYYSTDGKVWTQCTGIDGYLTNVVYSDGMWVAESSQESIGFWYSEDGKSWAQSNITTGKISIPAVRGNGIWVLGVYYSTDGKVWTRSNSFNSTVYQFVYANGMFQADTSRGVLYSFDGKTWSESNMVLGHRVCYGGMYYANGVWVGGMKDGVYYSTDGKVWIASNITYDGESQIVAYGNGTWITSVENFGTYYSTDGKIWTKSNDTFMFEMAYANGVWVGSPWPDISEGSLLPKPVLYSVDGKTWHESNITDDAVALFANNNGIWVAVGLWVAGAYYSVTWEPTT